MNESSSIELPSSDPSTGSVYRLERFAANASGGTLRHPLTERHAARLMMQATFGATLAAVRNISLVQGEPQLAATDWVREQMVLPSTLLRAHYRRRVNPRLASTQHNPFMEVQPACQPGSMWQRFAFDARDVGRTLTIHGLPTSGRDEALDTSTSLGYRMSISGEVRTEVRFAGVAANYTTRTAGRCTGLLAPIRTIAECTAAALTLGLGWDASSTLASYGSAPSARDDGRGTALRQSSRGPRGCYLEGRPPIPHASGLWINWRTLYFDVNDTNTGSCAAFDVCICKRIPLSDMVSPAAIHAWPPAAPPSLPLSPGQSTAGVTEPSQCAAARCCVVLYKGAAGANCNPVPIWDFAGWVHPGGDFVSASSMCTSVRYDWLAMNGNHGQCDTSQNCDPEADVWDQPFLGGAQRVGTYVETTSAACARGRGLGVSTEYTICDVVEGINGSVTLANPGALCTSLNQDVFTLYNPSIELSSSTSSSPLVELTVTSAAIAFTPVRSAAAADTYVLTRLDVPCYLTSQRSPTHLRVLGGEGEAATWYRLDRRLAFRANTVERPCAGVDASTTMPQYDGAMGDCPTVSRSAVNAHGCTRCQSCTAPRYAATLFQLNHSTLRAYYERAGVLAYYVRGLQLDDRLADSVSPCEPGLSRWWRIARVPCTSAENAGPDTALNTATRQAIEEAMTASGDTNEYLRDLNVQATLAARGGSCTSSLDGVEARGARLTIGGSCWQHVQRNEGNVYGFSYWATYHEGNPSFPVSDNPIARWARDGHEYIAIPTSHDMRTRWHETCCKIPGRFLPLLGRFGDVVDFAALPAAVRPREMADYLGASLVIAAASDAVQACGSPGEVASEPTLGHRYKVYMGPEEEATEEQLYPHGRDNGKMVVWTTVVLSAADQLRQRVAFALSQVLVIGEEGLGKEDEVEAWLNYCARLQSSNPTPCPNA